MLIKVNSVHPGVTSLKLCENEIFCSVMNTEILPKYRLNKAYSTSKNWYLLKIFQYTSLNKNFSAN